jgi:vacuolar protein sorting-associated protein 41
VIHSLTTPETYTFDFRRPMRAVVLEPSFAKRGTRAFVCGGTAGMLVMHEKGWLGHKESQLHAAEGPIWSIVWQGSLIAWANDLGVKIYDTASKQRIAFIDRPADSPRADLFKYTLRWQDDITLLIAWADQIKIARVRPRTRTQQGPNVSPFKVEVTAFFQVDCMISGLVSYASPPGSFLVLAYIPPDTFQNEATSDPAEQRRKAANRPELRIISQGGEETASDVLSLSGFHLFGCNDYLLQPAGTTNLGDEPPFHVVASPRNIVLVRRRDQSDHVTWLVERKRYEEALDIAETVADEKGLNVKEIGRMFISHLVEEGQLIG